MKIIISPAKQMRTDNDFLDCQGLPALLDRTRILAEYLKSLPYEQLKQLLCCSDKLAKENFDRYQSMDLVRGLTPAILSYDGIQYQYMAPQVFEAPYFGYIQKHLRILSGFYGILRPLDGVVPYRLEMQAKLKTSFCTSLYDFWKDSIYRELVREQENTPEDRVILNLASGEYSRAVKKYLAPEDRMVSCIFGELIGDKVVEKGVYVKMARGEMVRFLAERNAQTPEEAKAFDRLDFSFCPERSTAQTLVFLKQKPAPKQDF